MNIEMNSRSKIRSNGSANKPLRVLFLSSDTGGGHRASGMFFFENIIFSYTTSSVLMTDYLVRTRSRHFELNSIQTNVATAPS